LEANSQNKFYLYIRILAVFAVLYLFLVSIGMIGSAFKGLGRGFAESLFQSQASPFIGLFIGILATGLIQSSSTTTSLVVGMVAAGTFGSDPKLAVAAAVPYIMGANIGTSITNTIVSLGHIVNKEEFKRAFSASVVHDFFNIFAVIVIFPIELAFGVISKFAMLLSTILLGSGGGTFTSPIKLITKPTVKWIENLFHQQSIIDSNVLLLLVALGFLFFSLRNLTKLIKSLVMFRLQAFFDTHIFKTTLRAVFFGIIITILVQSSSITTSLVIPLAGAGVLTLRQIFPYTLGANIGTTVTSLLASMVSGTIAPLAVALSHLTFNLLGIALLYPFKKVREIPIYLAEWFSGLATQNKIYPLLYILIVFFLIPLMLITLVR
jgi:sodium-dependent phosphate cotransporter|tara:strand:- start:600 stop:1736 length:1137 start_codon:yes stop_codon:yes gene_type:complete